MRYLPSAYRMRAEKLAIMFLDDTSIPTRFKSNGKKPKKFKEDSKIETYFQETVQSWINMMERMFERDFPRDLIHQLIYLQVREPYEIQSVTDHPDWLEYNQYLIYVRNEIGDDIEIGRLSMLFDAWQQFLERKISRSKGLKNDLAQELMENGEIEIDGLKIKLWRGHSRDSVLIQENWNRLGSLGEMNLNKPKDCPKIVFTGIFQIPRSEVAQYASEIGFRVQGTVNKQTNYVVIGTENVGPTKIADLIKLRTDGYEVELLEENAFLEMVLDSGLILKGN